MIEPAETVSPSSSEEEEEDMRHDKTEMGVPLIDNRTRDEHISDVYNEYLERLGITFRFVVIIACSGIGLLSDTLEIMSISFAKDDITKQLQLSRQEESTLGGVLFAGMLIGGLFWGRAADLYGRRRVLVLSLTMNSSCAALSALMNSFPAFLVARFLSGVGVGGSLPIIFSYVSEWTPRSRKGAVISCVATCWMVGSVVAAGLAWAVLPQQLHDTYLKPWRIYLLLCSLPSLIAVLLYLSLHESPVYLIQAGRTQEALEVLRKYCGGRGSDVTSQISSLKRVLEDEEEEVKGNTQHTGVCGTVIQLFGGIVDLFSPPLRYTTLILLVIILPVHFGYYGLMLWFPEYLKSQNSSSEIMGPDYVYRESLWVSLANLPGNLATVFLTDYIGVKPILCGSEVLSAVSVFLLWKFNSPDLTVLLTCLFSAVSVPIFNMIDVLLPTLYPTRLRGTAFGFHTSLIRIAMILANWVFSLFIDTSPTVPILLIAFLMLFSAVVSVLWTPNTTNTNSQH